MQPIGLYGVHKPGVQRSGTAEWKWKISPTLAEASWLYPTVLRCFRCRSSVEIGCPAEGIFLVKTGKEGHRVHDLLEVGKEKRVKAIRVGTEVGGGGSQNNGIFGVVSRVIGQEIVQNVK